MQSGGVKIKIKNANKITSDEKASAALYKVRELVSPVAKSVKVEEEEMEMEVHGPWDPWIRRRSVPLQIDRERRERERKSRAGCYSSENGKDISELKSRGDYKRARDRGMDKWKNGKRGTGSGVVLYICIYIVQVNR